MANFYANLEKTTAFRVKRVMVRVSVRIMVSC